MLAPMQVRSAASTDAESIADLMRQLGYELSPEEVLSKLELIEASPDDRVFIAVEGGRLIGCLSAHSHELFHVEGRLGRITSLVVDQVARNRGVGRALVEEALKHFRAAACIRVEVTSGDHRESAHAFYKALGFAEDERRFIIRM